MSALAPAHPNRAARTRDLVLDSLALAGRNLQHVRQIPEKLLDVTIQPLMFVLLFAYVFGGVIHITGGSYREYLIGGVLIQTLAFGMWPPTAIATDLQEGIVDRFRSLPMARSAVHRRPPAGRARGGDARHRRALPERADRRLAHPHRPAARARGLRSAGVVRLRDARGRDAARVLVRSPDAAQGFVFIVVFPMTFIAATFVPLGGLPPVLRTVAEYNPVSALAAACRTLFGNPVGDLPANAAWPLAHPVLARSSGALRSITVATPLMLWRYRARTTG